jgi:apolipoprotein N-acyltransferase
MNISVALVRFLPFLQTASLFGNGIITFITVFSCCCIGLFLIDKQKKVLIKTASIVLTFNLVLGSIIFIIPEKRGKEVSACVIQGNVTMGEKWQFGVLTSVIKEHENLIRSALNENDCDVVLMAETVFPATYSKNGLIHQTLSKIAKEYNVTIIFGVILKAEDDGSYNAMMAIYPDGSTSEPYIKRQLVPFGEKLPSFDLMGKIVPALRELEGGSSYVEGTESINIPSHDGTIYGPLVCYDSVFPEFSRENVLNGAEIIAVSTNDSWYKDGKAVRQHQSQSCIRAIEAGRYVFRSANTGISCVINSKGKISEESEILKKDYVCAMGYEMNHKTLYVLFGNTSLYFSFIFIGILFLCKIYKKVIKERKN